VGRAPVESSGNNPRVNAPGDSIDAANDAPHPTAASSSAPEKLHHPDTSNSATEPVSVLTLCAVYALEVLAIAILRIPHELGLFMFAFGDRGSWLVVQYLVAHGYRPTIDFGFPYGLLPILFGRAWFAIFGLTPRAFDAAMVAGGLAMAFGMARFANAMRLNRVGQILVIVALPIAIQSGLPSLSHLLEAVLLCLAIGEHAQGNRGTALALTTAACFAKAALGYLYGFLLILLIVAACSRRDEANARARFDWVALRRTLMPAIITGLLMLAIVGAVFGARPLLASLLPLNGMKIYQSLHFGFFTPWSRTFWDPRVAPIGIYFATPAPFWLFSTIWLALAGLFAGWNLLRQNQSRWHWLAGSSPSAPASQHFLSSQSAYPQANDETCIASSGAASHDFAPGQSVRARPYGETIVARRRDEIIFCCAVLQTLFVLRLFGPPLSWTYYSYLVVMGVAAASTMNYVAVMGVAAESTINFAALRVTMALTALAFVAQIVALTVAATEWKSTAPTLIAAGLWADANERAEWITVTRLIAGHRTVAVGVAGAASILFPDFEKPVGAYLVRDEATPSEVARTIERIKGADFVVRPASESIGDPISFWPEMTRTLDNLQVIWKGHTYQVCHPHYVPSPLSSF
jgi:hypothetical protein